MSFLGGPECSTAGNPLTQFTKHAQFDNTLQQDRLVGGRQNNGLGESMRSRVASPGSDQMLNDFAQQAVPQPFMMDHMRHDLPQIPHIQQHRESSPTWTTQFDPGEQSRMEAAFAASKLGAPLPSSFSREEYQTFQPAARVAGPITQQTQTFSPMYRPMGMGMSSLGTNMYNSSMYQPPQDKGKQKMVELDDQNWEEQFAQLDKQDTISEQAQRDIEAEMNDLDRQINSTLEDSHFSPEDYAAWDNFDSNMGLNTYTPFADEPLLGNYMFEKDNPFLSAPNAYEKGLEIMRSHGNLSLAALAFEAAVQQNPDHVAAWVELGDAQAQNEKETPAIRALERAIALDPTNLNALMSLAISYTNESYDSTAYRTLERWLSIKYPSICPPDTLSDKTSIGFTDNLILHDKVTNLFIKAAQLSPAGAQMDPDVQVGLGVLFYGAEDFDKAIDCFRAALDSAEQGHFNRDSSVHLLWNRLGATLANSGKSEAAISAYSQALTENPNFVRARYNLGVSCINIGCYPEAAGHLLGALSLHRSTEGVQQAREVLVDGNGNPLSGGLDDAAIEGMIQQNESTNIYDTLRRAFSSMGRRDLQEKVAVGMNLDQFRSEFDF